MVETVPWMGNGVQVYSSFQTDVEELEYKDLLTNTFTDDHHRVIKTWGKIEVILSVCFAHTVYGIVGV